MDRIFQLRLARHSYKRIARALNDTAIPCPAVADPARNPHRTGLAWTEGAVGEILLNPVYTGYTVWGCEQTIRILIDPNNPALSYRKQRVRASPDQWTISHEPTHPALISQSDFLAVQGMRAIPIEPTHIYQLTGLLACTVCSRCMEATWSHGSPAYRCRHGHTSAKIPDTNHVNAFVRERDILARLPLLHTLMMGTLIPPAAARTITTASGTTAKASTNTAAITPSTAIHPEEVIDELRQRGLVLSYDPRTRTLEVSTPRVHVTV